MPDILFLRHGIAEELREAEADGRGEVERELTAEGVARTREVCSALHDLVGRIDRILTSPLARARSTAEILAEAMGSPPPEMCDELAPGGDSAVVLEAVHTSAGEMIALVGHEPDLSMLCGLLLAGEARSILDLKKAGAVLIHCDVAQRGRGQLIWALPPKVTRGLAS